MMRDKCQIFIGNKEWSVTVYWSPMCSGQKYVNVKNISQAMSLDPNMTSPLQTEKFITL